MKNTKRLILIILDGWGLGKKDKANAIYNADTPFFDSLMKDYPNSKLLACGESVGLPDGQMGNSEVGHLNIGAGRKIYHDLVRINKEIESNDIKSNKQLNEAFSYALNQKKKLHFVGLVSDGGVHSLDMHLYKLCELASDFGLKEVFIHAITDGRDTDPRSGYGLIESLLKNISGTTAKIASLIGRYYSMDRDKRWERIKKGYDLMVKGQGEKSRDILNSIQKSYDNGLTDEFIVPIVMVDENQNPIAQIKEGDVVICFNFRTDRLRQLTIALTQEDFPEQSMKKLNLKYYTMSNYDKSFKGIQVIYDKQDVSNTLGEVLAKNGKKQLRIAETEKYAHVTYFFSGGREALFDDEERIMVSSPKVATYDLQPEMSAPEVADKIVVELNKQKFDFICLNYANGDMVGHTGIYEAILKAASTVDKCLQKTVEAAQANDYSIIVTADHGNADHALNENGTPNTAHSLNPVPCILIGEGDVVIKDGVLADLAPTIIKILGIEQPTNMTGSSLI
ncbi:MAG: 2,3-bisphosphoglycerate-independent phosphoglycerate mutase [Bacteroidetes bacterium]|nr:2,3-bisphosphoglycerate-independent phosphoglycerate mutase [Bacteroidota bacterium]